MELYQYENSFLSLVWLRFKMESDSAVPAAMIEVYLLAAAQL